MNRTTVIKSKVYCIDGLWHVATTLDYKGIEEDFTYGLKDMQGITDAFKNQEDECVQEALFDLIKHDIQDMIISFIEEIDAEAKECGHCGKSDSAPYCNGCLTNRN